MLQYLKAYNVGPAMMISEIDFSNAFGKGKFKGLQERDIEAAFNSFRLDIDGFAKADDLIDRLHQYVLKVD